MAALSDLITTRWKEIFTSLEAQQSEFLAHDKEFRSKEYKWPRDALHNWSRIWEYPFAYHNIAKWHKLQSAGSPPVVVDLGSGVTFFPYAVARLGVKVVCTDIDPVCAVDFARAGRIISAQPGSVEFRLTREQKLPFSNGEADLVYCISVIEHVADFTTLLHEIDRILKPGGWLILTFDLDLRGDQQIGISEFYRLQQALEATFVPLGPARLIHHADVLTSESGPIRPRLRPRRRIPLFLIKQWVIKPLLGRPPSPLVPLHCAVQGVLLKKP